jgi:hypothetical protein
LDERPSSARIQAYGKGLDELDEADEWYVHHESFLDRHVRGASVSRTGRVLMRSDAPETFVVDPQFAPYSHVFGGLDLVRVVRADTVARLCARSTDEIIDKLSDKPVLEAILEEVNERRDCRPTFAGFYEDVATLLPENELDAPSDWADQLRDVLGLWQHVPLPGSSLPILVFRYSVEEVVRLQGMAHDRPLTVPTVLDIDQFEAFCPAPLAIPVGRLVDLAGGLNREPAGEVLHPGMPFIAEQFFRLGNIRSEPSSLDRARGAHLTWLQVETASDFAASTDEDVLSL